LVVGRQRIVVMPGEVEYPTIDPADGLARHHRKAEVLNRTRHAVDDELEIGRAGAQGAAVELRPDRAGARCGARDVGAVEAAHAPGATGAAAAARGAPRARRGAAGPGAAGRSAGAGDVVVRHRRA